MLDDLEGSSKKKSTCCTLSIKPEEPSVNVSMFYFFNYNLICVKTVSTEVGKML